MGRVFEVIKCLLTFVVIVVLVDLAFNELEKVLFGGEIKSCVYIDKE